MSYGPRTVGSSHFDPDILFQGWQERPHTLHQDDDLESSVTSTFNLDTNDNYVYHAIASVTLAQVQSAINHGSASGLHAWYLDEHGKPLPPPPPADILAYTIIFASTNSTAKLLTSLAANAKKGSLRARIAAHLSAKRLLPSTYTIPKLKKPHVNPYLDFWSWSCRNLEWAGPDEETVSIKTSHHILPVFMHHFGCVVPSYESLEIIRQTTRKRTVVEIGSGNGYWAYMLRRMGVSVDAVDNMESEYRTMWIGDTISSDGVGYLTKQPTSRTAVLLLVYPIVGSNFTSRILETYKGDTIVIAGTQNGNGYTAFKEKTIEQHVAAEMVEFEKKVQIALPSFAGKDEALFVFERRARSKE